MNVQHFEKGLHYTDKDLMVFARKIGKLATYCDRLKNADSLIRVEAEKNQTKKERDSVTVMVTIDLPGAQLRAESRKPRALAALDRCIDKLERQIKKYKDLHTKSTRSRIIRKHSRAA